MTKKYNYTKKTGRPARFTKEYVKELAAKLIVWANRKVEEKEVLWLKDFAIENNFNDDIIQRLNDDKKHREFSIAYQKVYKMQEAQIAQKALDGTYNAHFATFVLKNNHGWQDKQTIVSEGEQKAITPEEEKAYADAARAANLKLSKRSG